MKPETDNPQCFDFYFPAVDTLILVEQSGSQVLIRATRNTFSEPRKLAFIRSLAAEGFIPEEFLRPSWLLNCSPTVDVRWVLDSSWLALDPEMRAATHRFMVRLIGGAMLTWLVLMGMLLCCRAD